MNNFSQLSIDLTKKIPKNIKSNNGIFFTPQKTIDKNLLMLKDYFKDFKNVLEPSCGSCQYLISIKKQYKNLNLVGIEKNKIIYNSIKKLKFNLLNEDFLSYQSSILYDLIIGNPPYYVMKKNDVKKEYYNYFDGRPNIFILFIIKSLKLLNKNGILSFVLPKNFLNCLYYHKTRKYINDNFKILNIDLCDDNYIETKQETIIILIQNTKANNKDFVLEISDYIIFNTKENINQIKKFYLNSTNLEKLNFNVSVGNIVWNQHKNILTNDKTKTLLIYNSDIENNQLAIKDYSNPEKKNYIKKSGIKEPLLVINRGYGKGNYNFSYLLINGDFEYLIENHLIAIRYKKEIKKENLIKLYQKIIKSLNNQRTKDFIKLYFGNNAINTTELLKILPIYEI